MPDLIPEALSDALAMVIAELRQDWTREMNAMLQEARASVAELAAENSKLKEIIRREADQAIDGIRQKFDAIPLPCDGVDGKDGRDGVDGKDGAPGEKGDAGLDGKDGRDGIDGKDGETGEKGDAGLDGKDGRDGVDGKDGAPGEKGDAGLDGKDGRDGIDGKDGETGERGDAGLDGKDGRDGVDGKDGAPGEKGDAGLDGKDGRDGVDGKDGALGEKGDAGLDGKDGRDGVDGKDGALGEKGDAGLDGKDGRDGVDGKDGALGEKGDAGLDGKDGRGISGALIGRDGSLVLTMTDGEPLNVGPVVGKDGEPGLGFDDLDVVGDGERTVTFVMRRGDRIVEKHVPLPVVIDRGVWKEGGYQAGDAVTWRGSLWIAQRETAAKPDEASSDWRLAVKRGRDGKDARPT
jgi:integrin beta 3